MPDLNCSIQDLQLCMRTLRCIMWDLVPCQGLYPGTLHWELGALATGPPGKSPNSLFLYPPVWLYESGWRPCINWVPLAPNSPDSPQRWGVLFILETYCLPEGSHPDWRKECSQWRMSHLLPEYEETVQKSLIIAFSGNSGVTVNTSRDFLCVVTSISSCVKCFIIPVTPPSSPLGV